MHNKAKHNRAMQKTHCTGPRFARPVLAALTTTRIVMTDNNKKKHYLGISAASYALVAVVLAMREELPADAEAIGLFIGSGFGAMLLPIITVRFGGISAGWVVYAVLGFFYVVGSFEYSEDGYVQATAEPFDFQGMGCEFLVTFPSAPSIKVYTHPQTGDYEEALWTGTNPQESTVLRTECAPVQLPIDDANAKDFLLVQLAIFAENNGLSSVEYRFNNETEGPTGYARGIKYIQERPVTYSIAVVVGERSMITLYAGGLSAAFPSSEVTPFIGSIRKVN